MEFFIGVRWTRKFISKDFMMEMKIFFDHPYSNKYNVQWKIQLILSPLPLCLSLMYVTYLSHCIK